MVFNNYWLLVNFSIASYLTGSALIPLGLTWWQAIICIVIGNLLAAAFCVINSLPGAYYNSSSDFFNRFPSGLRADLAF